MQYSEHPPCLEAGRFIERFWTLEVDGAPDVQRIVPDGRSELILNFGAPFEAYCDGAWVLQPVWFFAGQITGPLLIRPTGPARITGVRFRPEGAAQLFRLPMHELADRTPSLLDVAPSLASSFNEATLSTIESSLCRQARSGDPLVTEAVRLITERSGAQPIGALATHLNISVRQLERRFESRVGLPIKQFARMQRFQRVFGELESEQASWAETAIACGYYDQAHLIRDFREFAGQPPALLLSGDELARHFLSHFSKTAERVRR